MPFILINVIQHEQYFFSFQAHVSTGCLSHATYSSFTSQYPVNNKCNRVKGLHWRWLIYALRNFLLYNNVTCFQKQPPLFFEVSKIPQKKHLSWSLFFKKLQAIAFCLKWWDYIKTFIQHKLCFCQILFLIDWRHKRL